jgi:hypothetical protein
LAPPSGGMGNCVATRPTAGDKGSGLVKWVAIDKIEVKGVARHERAL